LRASTEIAYPKVDFSTVGELTITQGERESLTIEAESNVMRRIKTEVRGGTLQIVMKAGSPWMMKSDCFSHSLARSKHS